MAANAAPELFILIIPEFKSPPVTAIVPELGTCIEKAPPWAESPQTITLPSFLNAANARGV